MIEVKAAGMNSLDTHILVYAFNTGCPEHRKALNVLQRMIHKPLEWILADQVMFEFYHCLRNPSVLTKPLSASEAARRVRFVSEKIGCRRCGWDHGLWKRALVQLESAQFPFRRTFDAVLATTLLAHGVKAFYTRNTKDFIHAGFQNLTNPIDT